MTPDLLVEIQAERSTYWTRTRYIAGRFFGPGAPQAWSGALRWSTVQGPAALEKASYKTRDWDPRPTTFSWTRSYPDFLVQTADEKIQDALRETSGALLRDCIEHPAGWTEVWVVPVESFRFYR